MVDAVALVPDLRPSLTLGWKLVRARLAWLKPRAGWAAARGPMAALQLSPERLGWQADKPDEWTEADDTRWVVDDTLDTTAITHKVQAEVRASLWRRAADHWGRGAEDGGGSPCYSGTWLVSDKLGSLRRRAHWNTGSMRRNVVASENICPRIRNGL